MKTKDAKRKESFKRNKERGKRSDEAQLHRLNAMSYTASRERARIANRLGITIDETWGGFKDEN